MRGRAILQALAGRGLGLEFVKQILEDPQAQVVAAARSTAGALEQLVQSTGDSRLHLLKLEVTNTASAEVRFLHATAQVLSCVAQSIL